MKKIATAVLLLVFILSTACSGKVELTDQAKAICGSWAYIHDPDTMILKLGEDGRAVFHDKEYSFDCDDEFIHLTGSDGKTVDYRYKKSGDDIYVFEQTTYTYSGEDTPKGLVGMWESKKDHWSFEFTDKGTFREDGYFPGYYSVDENAGTIKLIYNDMFEDTTCHYEINGNELFIEYPWQMVRMN